MGFAADVSQVTALHLTQAEIEYALYMDEVLLEHYSY